MPLCGQPHLLTGKWNAERDSNTTQNNNSSSSTGVLLSLPKFSLCDDVARDTSNYTAIYSLEVPDSLGTKSNDSTSNHNTTSSVLYEATKQNNSLTKMNTKWKFHYRRDKQKLNSLPAGHSSRSANILDRGEKSS
ncbi:hypothetical protein E2C01_002563 [Portunus trituberculatus]|uniref:Uncharacterized protein n=1 Tax=Portunus trituberculatus TaxID=210409 RepID=A0A5B7CR35_PORTR|nr:hypothetical protein [Portunus trituberculatus]